MTATTSSTTAEPVRCPRCGRELRGSALDGLCPACLMRQALAAETAPAGEGSVLFTASLSSVPWTLVTLLADDEECVTYLARERQADRPDPDRLAQLVVRKQHVPPSEVAEARQQLQRRRDALRKVSHPALVPVLDGGLTEDGHPFLVTAFVMATPLADLDPAQLRQSPAQHRPHEGDADDPAADPMGRLLEDARSALQALHEAGLVHGRVRAATVLARRTKAGATTVVTGYAPLAPLPDLIAAIEDDLQHLQRLTSTLRV